MQPFWVAPPISSSDDQCDSDMDETGDSEMLVWANAVVVAVWATSLVLFLVLLTALTTPSSALRQAKIRSMIAHDLRFNIT